MITPSPSCLRFDTQLMSRALFLAELKAGSSMLANIAMIAITTSNSMSVKPLCVLLERERVGAVFIFSPIFPLREMTSRMAVMAAISASGVGKWSRA